MANYITKHLPAKPWSSRSRRLFGAEYHEALKEKLEGAKSWRRSRSLTEEEEEIFNWLIDHIEHGRPETDRALDTLMYLALIVDERINHSK